MPINDEQLSDNTKNVDYEANGQSSSAPDEPEGFVDKIAKELNVVLPKNGEAVGVRIIALLSLVGGIGILAAIITDIFGGDIKFSIRLARMISGLAFIVIAYGLVRRKRWAIWFWGLLALITAFINPGAAIILVAIFIYLWLKREELFEGPIDMWFEVKYSIIKKWFTGK